jgi:hypothetical protein
MRAASAAESHGSATTGDCSSPFALLWQCKLFLFQALKTFESLFLVHKEKTYNPYYTLVCQYLCRSSHSYKVTLQYCLWDFLRGLGEREVGGAEVMKNLTHAENSFNVKNISSTRMKNVARAYAWWIAKDCCSLTVLKVRVGLCDFTWLLK